MKLTVLPQHDACRKCDLGEQATHAGIRGRQISNCNSKTAILVVGESPGFNEDRENSVFIGKSGKLLTEGYLSELPQVDVWATNAVKCAKPYKKNIKPKHIRECNGHLFEDFLVLQRKYESVWVLCVGLPAVQAVLGVKKLGDAFGRQGDVVEFLPHYPEPLERPVRVFSTYHPAFLLRDGRQGKITAVQDHLRLMKQSMEKVGVERAKVREVTPTEFLAEMVHSAGMLCLDIETYGILPGVEQNATNPALSAKEDGVPVSKQIICTAFATKLKTGEIVTTWVHHRDPGGPEKTLAILRKSSWLLLDLFGTNLLFDLAYLVAALPSWRIPQQQRIVDLCVCAFVENPDRPEHGLKALAPLLVWGEEWSKYGKKGQKYGNLGDLKRYNVQDVVNPILIWDVLLRRMVAAKLPPDPQVLLSFFSDLMKTLLHMTMAGVAFDRGQIIAAGKKWAQELAQVEEKAKQEGFLLSGKGSQKAIRALFEAGVNLYPEEEWELTKTKQISTGKANIFRMESLVLPPAMQVRVNLLSKSREITKLLGSYYENMERATRFGDLVFPHWFPVPSVFDTNDGLFNEEGGTRQCRVTCKRPALQTSPKVIKKMMKSRYRGGTLLSFDFSQLELRLAAMISGDAAMREEYAKADADLHHRTLCAVKGCAVDKESEEYDTERRKAKYVNFGIIYGITAKALKAALWKTSKIKISLAEAERFIQGFLRGYPRIKEWHEELIQEVIRTGRLVLPITGHWLGFPPPRKDVHGEWLIDKAILNFPIQGPAANIATVAQQVVIAEVTKGKLGVVPLNVYDAILVDTKMPRREAEQWGVEMQEKMSQTWYIRALHEHYGRDDRFPVDLKVLGV